MKHNEEEIRETLRLAHERTELRVEWFDVTSFNAKTAVTSTQLQAFADSFETLAVSNREGLPVNFTVRKV